MKDLARQLYEVIELTEAEKEKPIPDEKWFKTFLKALAQKVRGKAGSPKRATWYGPNALNANFEIPAMVIDVGTKYGPLPIKLSSGKPSEIHYNWAEFGAGSINGWYIRWSPKTVLDLTGRIFGEIEVGMAPDLKSDPSKAGREYADIIRKRFTRELTGRTGYIEKQWRKKEKEKKAH